MKRIQRYHVLSVYGDMKPHNYNDSVMIGSLHLANPINRMEIWPGQKLSRKMYFSTVFESFLKECFDNGLLMLVDNASTNKAILQTCSHKEHPTADGLLCVTWQLSPRDYDVQITPKGRECLGMEQIARDGDYSFYKNFDGSIDKAKQINPGLFKG